eukprot:COSAG05_NODE_1513_length_4667_cov_51.337785_2_plen_101_part_00
MGDCAQLARRAEAAVRADITRTENYLGALLPLPPLLPPPSPLPSRPTCLACLACDDLLVVDCSLTEARKVKSARFTKLLSGVRVCPAPLYPARTFAWAAG